MKRFILPVVMALMFGFVGLANALIMTDTTIFTSDGAVSAEDLDGYGWGAVNELDGITDYVQWTHHYDFLETVGEINSATLTVVLRDDGDWWGEYAFGWTENRSWRRGWGIGEVDTGSYTYNLNTTGIEDGEFGVGILSIWGDFYIDSSTLTVDYTPSNDTAPVPEPATILLTGLGLTGIAAFQRRRNANKIGDKK